MVVGSRLFHSELLYCIFALVLLWLVFKIRSDGNLAGDVTTAKSGDTNEMSMSKKKTYNEIENRVVRFFVFVL